MQLRTEKEVILLYGRHETTTSTRECESLHLAVKIGIGGVLGSLSLNVISGLLFLEDPLGRSMFFISLHRISFSFTLLASAGFMAVFLMKQSKWGVVYPLKSLAYPYILQIVTITIGTLSAEAWRISFQILGFTSAAISVLLLLSIRRVSANPSFLVFYAVYPLVLDFILMLLGPTPVTVASTLFYMARSIIAASLTVIFLVVESKQGCIHQYDSSPSAGREIDSEADSHPL
jgi:hypothetical protein